MEITDEMRQAVKDEACKANGHQYDVRTAVTGDGGGRMVLGCDSDLGCAPHLSCPNCGRVWLVVEFGDVDYEAAESHLLERLKDGDELAGVLRARRDHREEVAALAESVRAAAAEPDPSVTSLSVALADSDALDERVTPH